MKNWEKALIVLIILSLLSGLGIAFFKPFPEQKRAYILNKASKDIRSTNEEMQDLRKALLGLNNKQLKDVYDYAEGLVNDSVNSMAYDFAQRANSLKYPL